MQKHAQVILQPATNKLHTITVQVSQPKYTMKRGADNSTQAGPSKKRPRVKGPEKAKAWVYSRGSPPSTPPPSSHRASPVSSPLSSPNRSPTPSSSSDSGDFNFNLDSSIHSPLASPVQSLFSSPKQSDSDVASLLLRISNQLARIERTQEQQARDIKALQMAVSASSTPVTSRITLQAATRTPPASTTQPSGEPATPSTSSADTSSPSTFALLELKRQVYTRGNFAAKLARQLYTREERLKDCCISGRNGRDMLSPTQTRLKKIFSMTKSTYSVPDCEDRELMKEITRKIDEANRHDRRQAKRKLSL